VVSRAELWRGRSRTEVVNAEAHHRAALALAVIVTAIAGAAQRVSTGDPNAVNPSSGAGGKYQYLPSTWSGCGGYSRAEDGPESVQDERFNEVRAGGAGSSHWGC
jgi:hypothetical protein